MRIQSVQHIFQFKSKYFIFPAKLRPCQSHIASGPDHSPCVNVEQGAALSLPPVAVADAPSSRKTGVSAMRHASLNCAIVSHTLPLLEYGGAILVWPGVLFQNSDGRIHHYHPAIFFHRKKETTAEDVQERNNVHNGEKSRHIQQLGPDFRSVGPPSLALSWAVVVHCLNQGALTLITTLCL